MAQDSQGGTGRRRVDLIAVKLFCLMGLQYAVLTVNTAAIAHHNRLWVALTDIVIAGLGFTILKTVEKADTWLQMIAYTAGATSGAQLALWVHI